MNLDSGHYMNLDSLKSRISLLALVRPHVALRKRGPDSYLGLCPFHREKSPSFYVHPLSGYYKCFGCGASGDVIDFVAETQSCSKGDAIRMLREQCGVDLPHYNPQAATLAADCHAWWVALRWRIGVLNETTRLLDRAACSQFTDSSLDWESFRLRSRFERLLAAFDVIDSADPSLKLAIFRHFRRHVR